jgi:hypothetical protein
MLKLALTTPMIKRMAAKDTVRDAIRLRSICA